jgi:hypothetical protein
MEITKWPLPKRQEFIQEVSATETEKKFSFRYAGEMRQFNVYRVPIDILRYRLENGRTLAAQEAYIYKEGLSEEFFEDDESIEAQQAQHSILKKMLKTPRDLKSYFKDSEQDYPLILTRLGFVVNGNRRLCTFRELLLEDERKYSKYKYVDVVFLPHVDEEDIDQLEAELQLDKDIKAPYNWISEAYMLRRRHVKYGRSFASLADTFKSSDKEIQYKLDLLTYVDQYLESIGAPKQYEKVMSDEYAFKQFKKNRDKLKGDEKKELFTSLTFSIISMPREEGRLWEYIPKIAENLDPIVERLAEELDIDFEKEDLFSTSELDGLLDSYEEEINLAKLALYVKEVEDEAEGEEIVKIVKDVIDTEEELHEEKEAKGYVLKTIKKANTFMNNAYLGFNESSNTNGIEEQLKSIEEIVNKIRLAMNAND